MIYKCTFALLLFLVFVFFIVLLVRRIRFLYSGLLWQGSDWTLRQRTMGTRRSWKTRACLVIS